jgi:hypothetical protein
MIRAAYAGNVGFSSFFKDGHEFAGNPTALQQTLRFFGKL